MLRKILIVALAFQCFGARAQANERYVNWDAVTQAGCSLLLLGAVIGGGFWWVGRPVPAPVREAPAAPPPLMDEPTVLFRQAERELRKNVIEDGSIVERARLTASFRTHFLALVRRDTRLEGDALKVRFVFEVFLKQGDWWHEHDRVAPTGTERRWWAFLAQFAMREAVLLPREASTAEEKQRWRDSVWAMERVWTKDELGRDADRFHLVFDP